MFEFLSTNWRKIFRVAHTSSTTTPAASHYPQDRKEVNADIISEFAVLVFVHGESWAWGSSHLYDARILATLGRIIVVTFNYRLGVFGRNSQMSSAPPALYILTRITFIFLGILKPIYDEGKT